MVIPLREEFKDTSKLFYNVFSGEGNTNADLVFKYFINQRNHTVNYLPRSRFSHALAVLRQHCYYRLRTIYL